MVKRPLRYVPILKTKAGERWALSHLKVPTKGSIRPLLEFHDHRTKALGDHVQGICDSLQASWGEDSPFYVDTIWLHGNEGSPAIVAAVYDAAEGCNLRVIPVVRITYNEATLEQIQAVIEANDEGCLLRVTPAELGVPNQIKTVLDLVDLPPNKVDLLVDYRTHPMSLPTDLPKIANLGNWRRIISASGVFPQSLANLPLHTWQLIQRHDWTSWLNGTNGVENAPIYFDYGMRSPAAPAEFGSPSVNLRYATTGTWLVQMGGKHADGAAPEMHEMCADLIARPEYCGADFSAGDQEISRVSDEDEGPGGPTQWLQWSLNHHLEFVMHQLQQI